MKFTALRSLFDRVYPDGNIDFAKREYRVQFKSTGKSYWYAYTSHYNMAERLELIPIVDINVTSHSILAQLNDGVDYVVDHSGCGDTLRVLHSGDGTIVEVHKGLDEYDRPLSQYSIDYSVDLWSEK